VRIAIDLDEVIMSRDNQIILQIGINLKRSIINPLEINNG
jgi:hypothetical protein